MADQEDAIEHTVLVVRDVSVYKIPPRTRAGGFKSAEWKVVDKIWGGFMRVVVVGSRCEIRLEDTNSGELFAMCPVLPGKKDIAVEAALDSSRYFVIRFEDPTGRHAFMGLGFNERNEAFDFNVALTDFERQAQVEATKEALQAAGVAPEPAPPAHDYSLKEGQTIHVNVPERPQRKARPQSARPSRPGSARPTSARPSRPIAPLAPPAEDRSNHRRNHPAADASTAQREEIGRWGEVEVPKKYLLDDDDDFSTLATRDRPAESTSTPPRHAAPSAGPGRGDGSGAGRGGADPFADLNGMRSDLPDIRGGADVAQGQAPDGWARF
mmetsp:Transcript_20978/g.45993  ORF Transcript_20978/g.45993 Transcript_20978/m.45993 type:complete len:325 (-) Transcript_20978:190-1164(-)